MYNAIRNSVRLLGHLGQDPEVKQIGNGNKVAKCTIATSETYKSKEGEQVSETTWHQLVIWGKQAEIAERLMKKGVEVAIEGKISNRTYTDQEGVKRYVSEVIVQEFVVLTRKPA
ncbi:MAG: single-stranded DNA-binding protein [Bacteroidia bacterium]|jgi:single-strand DNA-binding protein